jgi:trans-2,3-dihydro-3-hydroxyanthranilate isomerase
MTADGTCNYRVVDVFTNTRFEGNPLAVFPDATGVPVESMQLIARELNLSETTFVLPSTRADCAARVRIYTPTREMAFAGHPTIGTAWVLRDEARIARDVLQFALQEIVGAVPVRIESGVQPLIWLTTPPIVDGAVFQPATCAALLGLAPADLLPVAPQLLSAGNPTIYIAVQDMAAVDRAVADAARLAEIRSHLVEPCCVFVFTPTPTGAYSRMFAPEFGVMEDPATGSSTGPLAAYMIRHGLASGAEGTRLVSEQGTKMGRRSLLHVLVGREAGAPRIEVGGHVVPVARGQLTI